MQFNGTDGSNPGEMNLAQGHDGDLYGTTTEGGAQGRGTVFKIGPLGKITTLYSFCPQTQCTDGYYPAPGLASALEGFLYGVTEYGGSNNGGTVFKITQEGQFTRLYTFCSSRNCEDGNAPNALVQGTDGNLYGTTAQGGVADLGTVFKITP